MTEVEKKKATKNTAKYIYAIGRRKRAVARVRLFSGKGQSMVNNKPLEDYFRSVSPEKYQQPFTVTKTTGKYYVTVRIIGGGFNGQLESLVHGVARTLVKVDEKNRTLLRQAGLMTRDPRERERRKYGLAQGARAAKQSPKR